MINCTSGNIFDGIDLLHAGKGDSTLHVVVSLYDIYIYIYIYIYHTSRSTHTAWTGSQEQAASHSKNTVSMYVAMLVISVTKASMFPYIYI